MNLLVRLLRGYGRIRRTALSWTMGRTGRREKTIMLICPTFKDKEYCLDAWIEAVKALTIPKGYGVSVWILENNQGRAEDVSYYKTICEKVAGLGWFVCHWTGSTQIASREHLANVFNLGLSVFRLMGYDYLFIVEADVILKPDHLERLLRARKPVVTGLVCYGQWAGDIGKYEAQDPTAGGGVAVPAGERRIQLTGMVRNMREQGQTVPAHLQRALDGATTMEAAGTLPGATAPMPMLFQEMSRSPEHFNLERTLLPAVLDGKAGWIPLFAPLSNHGFSVYCKGYRWQDIQAWPRDLVRVAGAGIGCILIRKEVFVLPWYRWLHRRLHPPLIFRWLPATESYNDIVFSMDLGARGWPIWCDRSVYPEHRHRQWVSVKV